LQNNPNNQPLSPAEIEVRVWAFVVGIVTVILAGIVFFMLYSVTFVTQPIKSMAPIDQGYLKMLNDIVLLIVGGIGGVMTKRAVSQNVSSPTDTPPKGEPSPPKPSDPSGALPVWVNPELDESWTPPPPPTTPANHLEPDHEREELALARAEQK
jgi:hypothetical protein